MKCYLDIAWEYSIDTLVNITLKKENSFEWIIILVIARKTAITESRCFV